MKLTHGNQARSHFGVGILVLMLWFSLCIPSNLHAQNLEDQEKALRLITDFADRLCSKIPLEGGGTSVDLSGVAKAELSGLLRNMASLGIQGSAKYQQSQFQGLLQKDLLAALKASTDCKLSVFNSLNDKLLIPAKSPSPPNVSRPSSPTAMGAPPAPPLRVPMDRQAALVRSWIQQMVKEKHVDEMWLSQIFQNLLDNVPSGPDVDVPAALRHLASDGEVEISQTVRRAYRTWWNEVFKEDIRFRVRNLSTR